MENTEQIEVRIDDRCQDQLGIVQVEPALGHAVRVFPLGGLSVGEGEAGNEERCHGIVVDVPVQVGEVENERDMGTNFACAKGFAVPAFGCSAAAVTATPISTRPVSDRMTFMEPPRS